MEMTFQRRAKNLGKTFRFRQGKRIVGSTCDAALTPSAISTLNQLEFVTIDFTHS